MELSQDQALARLSNPDNLAAKFSRGLDSPSIINRQNITKRFIPPDIRNAVALRAISGENQPALAAEFGITQGEVSALKTGKVKSDVDLKSHLDDARDLALQRLLSTLGFIDEDKLSRASLKDLSTVAASMSKVVDKTMPQNKEGNVTLVVYAPEIKSESTFRVVEVGGRSDGDQNGK